MNAINWLLQEQGEEVVGGFVVQSKDMTAQVEACPTAMRCSVILKKCD